MCGAIEGYKLDSTQENTHLDDSGGDHHVSDDEFKTPSAKVVETTISRRSSRGVGSRSTRSEDDLFADAVTDFVDSPGVGEASDDIGLGENSLQKIPENDPDGAKLPAVNAINDNSSASNIHVENNELQTVQKLEGQNDKAEGSMPAQDRNFDSINNSTLASALFMIENENAVEQQVIQSSTTSNELNLGVEEGNETSSKDLSELRTTGPEVPGSMLEDVSTLRDGCEGCQDSVCADGMVKHRGLQTCGFEGKVECSGEVDSPVNHHAPLESAQVIESNGNTGKCTVTIKEPDSKINSNENMHVVAAPDALHLLAHPEMAVEDLDYKRGKFNVSMGPDASLAFESVAFGEDPAIKESCFGNDFAKPGESSEIHSQHHVVETVHFTKDMLKLDVGQSRFIVLQHTGGEANQISDAEACNTDIGEFKGKEVFEDIESETCKKESGSSEEQKHNSSWDNVSLEGAVVNRSANQETRSNAVVIDEEHCIVNENDRNQVQVEELAATSLQLAESALAKEALYSQDANDNDHGKIRVEGTALNANERIGGEDDSKALSAEVQPAYGSTLPGTHESNVEAFEPEREYELHKILDSGNVMGGHSQLESQSTSRGVGEIRRTDDHMGGEECIKDDTGGIVENDDHLDLPLKMTQIGVSEMLENAGSYFPSSMSIRGSCTVEMAENASVAVEVDGTTKEHFAGSAVDTSVDSSSQSDSLEGNWGSVSVLSAISDAPLATDTAASNTSQASAEAVTAIMAPKFPEKGQHSESKTSVEPQVAGLKQKECTSEILTSQTKQQKSSALQIDWSPSVTRISNDQLADQRNEEIIAKVANWNTEKQHTPLKILLGEATARSRAESPCHDANPVPDHQKEEIPLTDNGLSAKTQNVLGTKDVAKEGRGKEWNSPARYPVNIKTEKRRAKNKPYWALFVCCSSVDAAR